MRTHWAGHPVGRSSVGLTSHLDIQSFPELGLHERDYAVQRIVVALFATAVWIFELWIGRFDPFPYRIGSS